MKGILAAALFVLLVNANFPLPASAADGDTLAKFKGGIGVIPVSNITEGTSGLTVNRNIVRGVNPAGQIWVINTLDARVRTNGDISVKGTGLVLGGGNNAGRATGQSVFATLICETTGTPTQHNTNLTGVPLTTEGDFAIKDVLTPLPTGGCASPMLLIRNAENQGWFAVGILDE
jgi:hypothetical protein